MAGKDKHLKGVGMPEIIISDGHGDKSEEATGANADQGRLFEIEQKVELARAELEKINLAMEKAKRESAQMWDELHAERARLEGERKNMEANRKKLRNYGADLDKKSAELQKERADFENSRDLQKMDMEHELAQKKEIGERKIKDEMAQLHARMLADLERERNADNEKWQAFEQNRRNGVIEALEKELQEKRARAGEEISAQYAKLRAESENLAKRDAAMRQKEADLSDMTANLAVREKRLDMAQKQLDESVERISGEKVRDLQAELKIAHDHAEEQRQHIIAAHELLGKYELLKQELGGRSPAEVLDALRVQQEELAGLHEKLNNEPSEAVRAMRERMEQDVRFHQEKAEKLQEHLDSLAIVEEELLVARAELEDMAAEKARLQQKFALLQGHNSDLEKEIERYRNATGTAKDKAERIAKIEEFTFTNIPMEGEEICYREPDRRDETGEHYDEIKWLGKIEEKCGEHGFVFPRRLLYAFHTALKVAEWSPLTVLAGVSGTGKSELPRLFSLFGGINFLPLPVQPNWDSQDDLLGYYNVIDNYFAAQPVLRLLAQAQKDPSENKLGLKKAMTIILLDEMNLAHIELYFAQFLSKFELRRGLGQNRLPKIDVNLGSDMSYQLPLDRNVLWVGTMNQDETTKSLSDKVLDRGIVLHFPRPSSLKRREILSRMPAFPEKLLPRAAWAQWVQYKSRLLPQEIEPFKQFVEEINRHLLVTGRALGHRVWQSMEYYMANYPTVRWRLDRYEKSIKENEAAQGRIFNDEKELNNDLRAAFEDQLVQKVMPKLRGIETSGVTYTDCLKKIEGMLTNEGYDIVDDFRNACVTGYGQFIWNSADYLVNSPVLPDEYAKDTEKAKGDA